MQQKEPALFVNRKQRRKNVLFGHANPGFAVPPKALAYDAYSWLDWENYRKSGTDTATLLSQIASRTCQKIILYGFSNGDADRRELSVTFRRPLGLRLRFIVLT